MKRLEATITGRVQGVFFRDTARREAQHLGLTGWVRNEPDGSVRVVAEGNGDDLQLFEQFLHRGSPSARVEHVAAEWREAKGEFSGFRIRP